MKKPETKNGLIRVGRFKLQNSPYGFISGKLLLIILSYTVLVVTVLMLIPTCESINPSASSEETGQWYRGNTHTHARFSDENDINDVPMIAGWYEEAGYGFLLLSEHNDHVAMKKVFSHDMAAWTQPVFVK